MHWYNLLLLVICIFPLTLFSQTHRLFDRNSIGWYNYQGTYALRGKFSWHTEFQWRRDEWIKNWQQSVVRTGVNYQVAEGVQFRIGYGWFETFVYGDIPLNRWGKNFTEHRIFQVVTLSNKMKRLDLSHRFMLEQRFIGVYHAHEEITESEYRFVNRGRYMFRIQLPLNKPAVEKGTVYLAAADEILIGFGKNIGENVFDQNRIYGFLGYQPTSAFRLEAGFVQQLAQLGREINGQNVFQNNRGVILNTYIRI